MNAARSHIVIAIDGPAASGKSSVARALARRLAFAYVNTGAMYRAATWLVVSNGVPPDDAERVQALLQSTKITCGLSDGESTILVDGADPSGYLVDESVNANVSTLASLPGVRRLLVEHQRAYAADHDLVMEGRDIGSVVFPDADVKIYLDASAEERARRRAHDTAHAGSQAGQAAVAEAIQARDLSDKTRTASPLALAPGAMHIDTTGMPIESVVDQVLALVREKLH